MDDEELERRIKAAGEANLNYILGKGPPRPARRIASRPKSVQKTRWSNWLLWPGALLMMGACWWAGHPALAGPTAIKHCIVSPHLQLLRFHVDQLESTIDDAAFPPAVVETLRPLATAIRHETLQNIGFDTQLGSVVANSIVSTTRDLIRSPQRVNETKYAPRLSKSIAAGIVYIQHKQNTSRTCLKTLQETTTQLKALKEDLDEQGEKNRGNAWSYKSMGIPGHVFSFFHKSTDKSIPFELLGNWSLVITAIDTRINKCTTLLQQEIQRDVTLAQHLWNFKGVLTERSWEVTMEGGLSVQSVLSVEVINVLVAAAVSDNVIELWENYLGLS